MNNDNTSVRYFYCMSIETKREKGEKKNKIFLYAGDLTVTHNSHCGKF